MNASATNSSPKSIVSKRVVSSVLVAMLVITAVAALFGGADSALDSVGLLTLLWPTSMIALASYWLRGFLAERVYFDADVLVHFPLSASGLYMAPVFLAQR